MERPRLLFVAPWYLFPTDSGGKIRTADILRGMKGGRFHLTLASPWPADGRRLPEEEARAADAFVGWTRSNEFTGLSPKRLGLLLSSLPVSVAGDRNAEGRRVVAQELARRPDVVVVDFVHTAVLLPPSIPVPSVLFTHNVEAEIFRRHAAVAKNPALRLAWRDQWRKMRRFERATLARFSRVVAVAERDREQFRQLYGIDEAKVIPTGADLDFYAYSSPATADDAPGIVFVGAMDWAANIDGLAWLMDQVWPKIAAARPDATLTIVGRNPPESLTEAARQRRLPWTFTGFVDDIRPHVRRAQVSIIPLRVGGGTRLKAAEAMACGRPIVATTLGVEGLGLEPERHFLAGDTPDAFADGVLRLLADADLRVALAERARAFVEDYSSSKRVAAIFEDICWRTATAGRDRR